MSFVLSQVCFSRKTKLWNHDPNNSANVTTLLPAKPLWSQLDFAFLLVDQLNYANEARIKWHFFLLSKFWQLQLHRRLCLGICRWKCCFFELNAFLNQLKNNVFSTKGIYSYQQVFSSSNRVLFRPPFCR